MDAERPLPADPGELLAQRAWMQRLAAALAGAEGEDVVQETWLRLLTRPMPVLERPRAWLASALRNAARSRARGEERRRRREERAPIPENEPSTDELAARAELEQLAVRAVLELAEPYREALLLCYLRGLEPVEIARRLGVPPSTVRNRIARGLEQVRARPDARHDGGRGAWLALFTPLERWSTASTAAGTGAAVAATGGLLMSTKGIAAGAALTVLVAWFAFARATSSRHDADAALERNASAADLRAPAESVATDEHATTAQSTASPSARVALGEPPARASATSLIVPSLIVTVKWERDGTPAVGLPITVTPWAGEPFPIARGGTTDDAGSARFEDLAPGSHLVDTSRDANESVEIVAGTTKTVELVIPTGVDVDCRVTDEGVPVAGAEVWLSDYGNDSSGTTVGRTDARGHLFLRDLPSQGHRLAAFADGHAPSWQVPFHGHAGDHIEIELALHGTGAGLDGSVVDARGAAVPGAEVLLGRESPGNVQLADGSSFTDSPAVRLRADERGRFVARGLKPQDLSVQARAPGLAPGHALVELVAGEVRSYSITLAPEARVLGVVRDGDGGPLADVDVTGGAQYFDFDGRQARTRADGSFVLGGLGSGECLLGASSDTHGHARTSLVIASGEEAHWDPVLVAGGEVAGVVLDERDAPLVVWQVTAIAPGEPGLWLREDYTDADGRFRLVNCPTQRFALAVRAPEERFGVPVAVVDDFELGQDDLVITIRDADHPTAFLTGRVAAADGRVLVQPLVVYDSGFAGTSLGVTPDAEGRFRIGPLRPAVYALVAQAAEMGELRVPAFELAAREEKNVGELVLEPPGTIHVRLNVAEGAAPLEGIHTDLFWDSKLSRELVGRLVYSGLDGTSAKLGRGRYRLHTRSSKWHTSDQEVEVVPGTISEVELALQPATSRTLSFRVPTGDASVRLDLRVRDERGDVVEDYTGPMRNAMRNGDAFGLIIGGLVPGAYSFEARTDNGRSAAGSFDVLDLEPLAAAIEIELR